MQQGFYTIVGPTSSGKTSLALRLCKEHGGVIVSADSRQIYKYMDLGTGKIPVDAQYSIEKAEDHMLIDSIPIYGIDLVTPAQSYSVFSYAQYAINKLNELFTDKSVGNVFLVGGTGFYIDVVCGKMKVEGGDPDYTFRQVLETKSLGELQDMVKVASSTIAEKIDLKNKVRLIRALERLQSPKQTQTLPEILKQPDAIIGLTADRETLYTRADNWLEHIWEHGLVEEVQYLIKMGYEHTRPVNGLVYKSVLDMLAKRLTEEEAQQRAKFDLHSYIRRQQTWFKKNDSIVWLTTGKDGVSNIALDLVK